LHDGLYPIGGCHFFRSKLADRVEEKSEKKGIDPASPHANHKEKIKMENFYFHLGRRHVLPSTRQILKELGKRKLDVVTTHVQTVSREQLFPTDIYGKKVNG
jgi:hypothetical protein